MDPVNKYVGGGGEAAHHCERGETGFMDTDRYKCVDSALPL